jgi:thiol:disulfide interchange protein DsbC
MKLLTIVALTALVFAAQPAVPADDLGNVGVKQLAASDYNLRAQIASRLPGADASMIELLPEAGLYEVRLSNRTVYVTADGKFVVTGDLLNLATKENITARHKSTRNLIELQSVKDDDTIVFAPGGAVKHTITVFTDVDCAYCRKLHGDIAELNSLGIKVRYVLFPRAGKESASWAKSEAIWCSANRKESLTRMKKGEQIKADNCSNPIAKEYELAQRLGIPATPAIFTESGALLPGYSPPDSLVRRLDALKAR